MKLCHDRKLSRMTSCSTSTGNQSFLRSNSRSRSLFLYTSHCSQEVLEVCQGPCDLHFPVRMTAEELKNAASLYYRTQRGPAVPIERSALIPHVCPHLPLSSKCPWIIYGPLYKNSGSSFETSRDFHFRIPSQVCVWERERIFIWFFFFKERKKAFPEWRAHADSSAWLTRVTFLLSLVTVYPAALIFSSMCFFLHGTISINTRTELLISFRSSSSDRRTRFLTPERGL